MSRPKAWKATLSWIRGGLCCAAIVGFISPAHAGDPFWIESVRTKQHYEILTLDEYSFVYTDRDFVFTEVPTCLQRSRYIVTANSDKFFQGPRFLTISSELPVTIYVGYDSRYPTLPDWLKEKFDRVQNLHLAMGEPKFGKTQVVYDLYRAKYPPGRIELGGNLSEQEKSNFAMFTAIIVEESQDRCQ